MRACIYSPPKFWIRSKNRVQIGSKQKTIHASILTLLQHERRLYVENVSHRLTVEQGHFVWWSRRSRPGYSVWINLYEVTKLLWDKECPTYSHACPRFATEDVWWLTNISAVPLICSGGIQTALSCFTFTRNCICSHCWLGRNMAPWQCRAWNTHVSTDHCRASSSITGEWVWWRAQMELMVYLTAPPTTQDYRHIRNIDRLGCICTLKLAYCFVLNTPSNICLFYQLVFTNIFCNCFHMKKKITTMTT